MSELVTYMIIALVNILVLTGFSLRFLGVAITFSLLNFVLLGLLGVYVFVKYLLPFVYGELQSRKLARKKMNQAAQGFDVQRKDLIHAIKQQDHCIKSLNLKLNAWKAHFDRVKKKRIQEKKEITRAMHERIEKQFQHMEAEYMRDLVLPDALKEAEKKLTAEFTSGKDGEVFIANIIKAMNKRA